MPSYEFGKYEGKDVVKIDGGDWQFTELGTYEGKPVFRLPNGKWEFEPVASPGLQMMKSHVSGQPKARSVQEILSDESDTPATPGYAGLAPLGSQEASVASFADGKLTKQNFREAVDKYNKAASVSSAVSRFGEQPTIYDTMAPAGSQAAAIRSVVKGEMTQDKAIEAMTAIQNQEDQRAIQEESARAEAYAKEFGNVVQYGYPNRKVAEDLGWAAYKMHSEVAPAFSRAGATTLASVVDALNFIGIKTLSGVADHFEKTGNVDAARKTYREIGKIIENPGNETLKNFAKDNDVLGKYARQYAVTPTEKIMMSLPEGAFSGGFSIALFGGLGVGGGKALLATGAGQQAAVGGSMLASTLGEAATEAGSVFSEAVAELEAKGIKREDAISLALKAGDKTFKRNLLLLGVTNRIGPTWDLMKRAVVKEAGKEAVKRGLIRTAAKVGFDSLVEGQVEERGQAAISQEAMREAIKGPTGKPGGGDLMHEIQRNFKNLANEYNSEQAKAEGTIGSMIGLISAGGEVYAQNRESGKPASTVVPIPREPIIKDIPQGEDPVVEQPIEAPQPKPTVRTLPEVTADIAKLESEIAGIQKQPKPKKEGSKEYVAKTGELEMAKSMLENLSQERQDALLASYPQAESVTEPTGDLNLSEQEIGLQNGVMPTEAAPIQAVLDQLTTKEQRSAEHEARIKGAQDALQVRATTEVGTLQGWPEAVGQENGGGIRQGQQGNEVAKASQAQQVAGPYDIPSQTIDRAVQIRNALRIAESGVGIVPEGLLPGMRMRASEATRLVNNYNGVVEQLSGIAMGRDAKAKSAQERIRVEKAKMEAGVKRIQRELSNAIEPHLDAIQESTGVDYFSRTKKAISEAASGRKATSMGFLEIGSAILMDLADMGMAGFAKFVQNLRSRLDAQTVIKIQGQFGGLKNFYDQSLAAMTSKNDTRSGVTNESTQGIPTSDGRAGSPGMSGFLRQQSTATEGLPGNASDLRASTQEVSKQTVEEAQSSANPPAAIYRKELTPATSGVLGRILQGVESTYPEWRETYGLKEASILDKAIRSGEFDGFLYESTTPSGRPMLVANYDAFGANVIDGVIGNGNGLPNFFRLELTSDPTVGYVEWKTTAPGNDGYVPGQSRDMQQAMGDVAQQFGFNTLWGYTLDGRAASTTLIYDGATLDSIGAEHAKVTVPVISIVNDMRDGSDIQRLVGDRVQHGMDISETDPNALVDTIIAVDIIKGNVEPKIEYLGAGINPFMALDKFIESMGGESMSKKLGINWNDMKPGDWVKVAKEVASMIGGLGKTSVETATKLYKKFAPSGMTVGIANGIANKLHSQGEMAIKEEQSAADRLKASLAEPTLAIEPVVKQVPNIKGDLSRTFLKMAHPAQVSLRNAYFKAVHDSLLDYDHAKKRVLRIGNEMSQAVDTIATDEMKRRTITALSIASLEKKAKTDAELKQMGLGDKEIGVFRTVRATMDRIIKLYVETRTRSYNRNLYKLQKQLGKYFKEGKKADVERVSKQIDEYEKDYLEELKIMGYEPKKGSDDSYDIRGGKYENNQYFPLMRNGDHMIEIYDNDGERLANPFIFGDSPQAVADAFDLAASQSQKVRELLRQNNGDVTNNFKITKLPSIDRSGGGIVFDASYMKMIAAARRMGDNYATEMEIAMSNMIGNQNLEAHMKHRTGFHGWTDDIAFVVSAYTRMMANRIAITEHGGQISEAIDAIPANEGNVKEAATKLKDATLNPPLMSDWGKFWAAMDFNQFLGLTGITPVINRTQPWLVGYGMLSSIYGGPQSAKALLKTNGIADTFALHGMFSENLFGGLDSMTEEQIGALVDRAVDNSGLTEKEKVTVKNVLKRSATNGDLQARPDDTAGAQDRGTLGEIMRSSEKSKGAMKLAARGAGKLSGYVGFGMTWSEIANRVHTIAAAALLTQEYGWVEVMPDGRVVLINANAPNRLDRVLRNAERLNGAINYTGGTVNQAAWKMNPSAIAQALGRFKSVIVYGAFGLHTQAMVQAKKSSGGNMAKALEIAKPWVRHHLLVSALAGQGATMVGYPLWLAFSAILKGLDAEKWFEEQMNEVRSMTEDAIVKAGFTKEQAESIREKAGTVLGSGLIGLTGMDVTASFAPNVILKGNSIAEAVGFAALGPAAGATADMLSKLWKYRSQKDVALFEAAKAVEPRAVKGAREAFKGKAKISGEEGTVDLTPMERGMRMMSAQITKVTKRREILSKEIEKANDSKAVIDTLRKGLADGVLDRQEVISRIREYNQGKRGKDRIDEAEKSKILSVTRMQKKSMREIERQIK